MKTSGKHFGLAVRP